MVERSKPTPHELAKFCSDVGPDDGIDPRDLVRASGLHRNDKRKLQQLCKQIAENLVWILTAECRDEVLRALDVVSVTPAPNNTRLLVTLAINCHANEIDLATAQAHVERARGMLRSEVAMSIHRRKVPELVFRIVE